MSTTALAIAISAPCGVLGVAIIMLVLKLGSVTSALTSVTPTLVENGKAYVQALVNTQTAENERDGEKALREQTEAENADLRTKYAAALKELGAQGAKHEVATTASGALDELHASLSAGGSGASPSADHGAAAAEPVHAAEPAKPTDGGTSAGK